MRSLTGIVAPGAQLTRVATGFGFTEGPNWSDAGSCLVFSDIPGDTMWRWDERLGSQVYRKPSHMANGGAYDPQGRLVTCEHATSRLVREEGDGTVAVLADHYGSATLNSPNDVVVTRDGTIYFTDPTYGRAEYFGVPRAQELSFQGLFRLRHDGALELLADDFDQPNGLCLSLDERALYVNDTTRMHIRRFELSASGDLGGGDVWVEVSGEGDGAPDGMKLDSAGRVFCTGPGGLHVYDQGAAHLGVIEVPEMAANFNWGTSDRGTLFICASTSLYSIRTEVPGVPGR